LEFRKEEGRASSWLVVVFTIQEEGKRTCWKRWLPKTYSLRLECHDPKPNIVL
jgi:hypothetical protein